MEGFAMTVFRGARGWIGVLGLMLCSAAAAQTWPTKNVTIVVPWPPGGPSDIVARPTAKGLGEAFGKTFIIDNRGGAGGNIGSEYASKQPADGYTLLITSGGPIVINPYVYTKMSYDPQKDLAPITNMLRVPLVLAVHPSVPAKNLQELIAYIKAQDGKAQWASAGNGTPQHMTGELFRTTAKLDMIHVPYKGSAPAITDLIGGHVPMMFDTTIAIMPHIKAGKVKAIAVSGVQRSPQLPDVPTFAEGGLPGVESYGWYGFFAPAKTPKDVVARINEAALKFMKSPDFQKVLAETGSDYVGDTPENFAAFVKAEAAKWGRVAKETGAKLD
jgi:tripartite-type tricarboxylate transporter receptor subunit TctC